MSRTEIEEALLTIQNQLTALRHAAHVVADAAVPTRMDDFSQLSARQGTRR
jgi:hypothetical protein